MKVQMVVVKGKPEGMTIPLAGPSFKIGRGEGCQLRPNIDEVSREHALIEIGADSVVVSDLGSRNGTEINGKKLTPREPLTLKSGDLLRIGSLTFAVVIEGAPAAKVASAGPARKSPSSLDDVSGDEIDAWLVTDEKRPAPDRPSGVFGGDTVTLDTLKEKTKPPSKATIPVAAAPKPVAAPAPKPAPKPEPEPEPEAVRDEFDSPVVDDGIEDLAAIQAADAAAEELPEDMVDESNPFYVKKAQPAAADAPKGKAPSRDSSDAANDILRKMLDRRRASRS